jgi:cell division protein FtsB
LHLSRFSGNIMHRSLVGGDMTSPSSSVETQKVGGGYKLWAGIALVMGVSMVLVILFSHRGIYNVYRFHQEWLRLEQENSRLATENDRLARTIDRLQHDPEYIQDRIRQELNFVKKNEFIFQFPPESAAPRRRRPGSRPFPKGRTAPPNWPPEHRTALLKRGPAAAGSEPFPVTVSQDSCGEISPGAWPGPDPGF